MTQPWHERIPRDPEVLLKSGLAVIDAALQTDIFSRGKRYRARSMAALFSGGHDSACACFIAAQHTAFAGSAVHIDTGIGSKRTRQHVEGVCKEQEWDLTVLKSASTYEKFIRERGFPGPGRHQWIYQRIKERCVRTVVKGRRVALITGCRSQESIRRMGHVAPVQVGEWQENKKTGEMQHVNKNRVWTAPCHDWSAEEQVSFMDYFDLPKNPVKIALGMSGECFCGAYAAPGEEPLVRFHCPDVGDEIDRLTCIARQCEKHDKWGTRPEDIKGIVVERSGPLCSTCDLKAHAAGIITVSKNVPTLA